MSNKRQNKNKKKQKPKSKVSEVKITNTNRINSRNDKVVLFKDIVPPKLVTRLKYIVQTSLYNAGLSIASKQLNANGVYDVDPALATTSVPGFAEFASLYWKYRVLKVKSTCTFINREAFPMLINLGFENTFFAANTKGKSYFDTKDQKTLLVPQNQTARGVTLSMTKTADQMIGDQEGDASANWANYVNGNPAALYYCSAAADCSITGNVFAAGGVAVRWEVDFWTEFYDFKSLTS